MRVYQVARKSPTIFKSLTGLRKSEFDRLVIQFKHYKILGDEFRGSSRLCDASLQAIAGLYNFKRQSRKRNI